MSFNRIKVLGFLLVLLTFLASCSGGGGGGDSTTNSDGLSASGSNEVATDTRTLMFTSTARIANANYVALVAQFTQLLANVQSFCSSPNSDSFASLRQQSINAFLQWGSVQALRFGPSQVDNRFLRTQFWPDTNNNVERSVASVIASGQFSNIASASAAAQGLSALEVLLFRDGFEVLSGSTSHCDYLTSIAQNLQAIAQQISSEWSGGYDKALTSAGVGSSIFSSVTQAVVTVLTSIVTHVEQIKNSKVRDPAGLLSGSPQLQRLETRFAGIEVEIIKQNISTINELYFGNEQDGIDAAVTATGDTRINDAVRNEIAVIQNTLSSMSSNLANEINNNSASLNQLNDSLTVLVRLLKNNTPLALGVSIGFNDTDGD